MIEIICRDVDTAAILKVSGYIDAAIAPALHDALKRLRAEGRKRFIIDCKKLTYISSQGIWAILKHAMELREMGGDICLASVPECVQMVISGLRIEGHLVTYSSAEEAAVSFFAA